MTVKVSAYSHKVDSFGAQSYFLREAVASFSGTKPNSYSRGGSALATADKFSGIVKGADGTLVLIPYSKGVVGLINAKTGAYSDGPAVTNSGSARFRGGCLHPDTGLVVMAPLLAANIGLYDSVNKEYALGPEVGASAGFCGAVVSSLTNEVILVPGTRADVGIFNAVTRTYRKGAAHGISFSNQVFSSAEELPNGLILMTPYSGGKFMLYDPVKDAFVNGPASSGTALFFGSCKLPNGDVVCTPYSSGTIAIYRWRSNTLYSVPCASGGAKFRYSAMAPDGRIVFGPGSYDAVGWYDPATDAYGESAALSLGVANKWVGVGILEDGSLAFAPFAYEYVGLFKATEGSAPLPEPAMMSSLWNKA